jgi:hypothetical protein
MAQADHARIFFEALWPEEYRIDAPIKLYRDEEWNEPRAASSIDEAVELALSDWKTPRARGIHFGVVRGYGFGKMNWVPGFWAWRPRLSTIGNDVPTPTMIVNTGQSEHWYWLFDGMIEIHDEMSALRMQDLMKDFDLLIEKAAKAKGEKHYHLCRLSQKMWVPGTINYTRSQKGAPVTVHLNGRPELDIPRLAIADIVRATE